MESRHVLCSIDTPITVYILLYIIHKWLVKSGSKLLVRKCYKTLRCFIITWSIYKVLMIWLIGPINCQLNMLNLKIEKKNSLITCLDTSLYSQTVEVSVNYFYYVSTINYFFRYLKECIAQNILSLAISCISLPIVNFTYTKQRVS